MSHARVARLLAGLVVAALGVVLVFSPTWVSAALHRPASTIGEKINLRATWGGTLAGLGAFVAAYGSLRAAPPHTARVVALFVLCLMAGIGAARIAGFALDGAPDAAQWIWIAAEAALVVGALVYLRR